MRIALSLFCIIAFGCIGSAALDAATISGFSGIGSAQIQLSGTETLTITASPQGYYFFRRVRPGPYVITPSLSGYIFNPPSISVNVNYEGVNSIDFTATASSSGTPAITGLVATPTSISLSSVGASAQLDVKATYSGGAIDDVTNQATYASNNNSVATVSQSGMVTAISNGSARIVASFGGMAASATAGVNILGGTYSVTGSAGVGAASVSISGSYNSSTTASSNGAYTFSGLTAGNYTITPSLSGYSFNPSSQNITVTDANLTAVNFTATSTEPHLVDLSWSAGTIQNPAAGQTVLGYNVYRSAVSGGPYTQLNSAPVVNLDYTDMSVSAGQTLYYVCSTVDNLGNVSGYSNEVSATVPGQ